MMTGIDPISTQINLLNDPNKSATEKANIVANIIQFKNQRNEGDVFKYKIQYIDLYINLFREHKPGYYDLNKQALDKLFVDSTLEEDIYILKYVLHKIKKEGLEDHYYDLFLDTLNKKEFKFYWEHFSVKNFFLLIVKGMTYNHITALLSLFLVIIVFSLTFLPAIHPAFVAFNYKPTNYSNTTFLNNILNTITYLLDIETEAKLIPANPLGVFLLALNKILIWGIVFKILLDKLNKNIF